MAPKKTLTSPAPTHGRKLTIGFGLVNVNVAMKSLVVSERPVPGKGICPEHGPALNAVSLCSAGTEHEHVLAAADKLTGYPHPDDPSRLVVVDPATVKSLAEARDGQGQITKIVDAASIDSAYTEKAYLLWPQPGSEQAFDLLAAVLRDGGKAAIVEAVLYKQTELVSVRWHEELGGGCLIAETIRVEQKIRHDDAELVHRGQVERGQVDERMLAAAKPLLDAMEGVFDADEAQDTWTPLMQSAIRAADVGDTFEPTAAPTSAPVVDLMAALTASVAAAKPAAKKPRAKKVAA